MSVVFGTALLDICMLSVLVGEKLLFYFLGFYVFDLHSTVCLISQCCLLVGTCYLLTILKRHVSILDAVWVSSLIQRGGSNITNLSMCHCNISALWPLPTSEYELKSCHYTCHQCTGKALSASLLEEPHLQPSSRHITAKTLGIETLHPQLGCVTTLALE